MTMLHRFHTHYTKRCKKCAGEVLANFRRLQGGPMKDEEPKDQKDNEPPLTVFTSDDIREYFQELDRRIYE